MLWNNWLINDTSLFASEWFNELSATSGGVGCGLTDKNVKVVEIPSTFNGK